MKSRLFLIDGSSFCYRAFYAIRELSTSRGMPTNAVYGVTVMLRRLLEEERPDRIAVAFDLPKPTFRHERFPEYKRHRPPMPEPLAGQIPWIKEVLKAFRIPICEREGYEADDVLATLASAAAKKGWEVTLVTGDKDALQLLGPNIRIYRPKAEGHELLDEEALRERWGILPPQVVEVMALMGDETDGIPGVPGIGEKTAVQLIQKFGSAEGVLNQLEKEASVKPAVAKRLREHREQIALARELAALDREVPLDLEWRALERREPDWTALRELFRTLEFRTLAKELLPPAARSELDVRPFDSEAQVQEWLPAIRRAGRVGVSIASSGEHPTRAELLGVAVSSQEGKAALASGEVALGVLKPLWEERGVVKVLANLKETLLFLATRGLTLEPPWADPGIASYLLDPGRPSHDLATVALEYLGEEPADPDPLRRAAAEAEAAWRLLPRLEEEVGRRDLGLLLREVELPLAAVLARMEQAGIGVDPAALADLGKEFERGLSTLTRTIHRLAGEEFNIASPKQLGEVLFAKLKLPVVKRTKTGASTDEEVLRTLSQHHELPAKVLEYRELAKLKSTYVDALPPLIHPGTGRVHCSFNQTVTATGRLSSSNPNLQNIPIRTGMGRRIRRAFVPAGPGGLFLSADYSQIELRILAHLSEDEALIEAFRRGEDIHRVTAAQIFHKDPGSVAPEERAVAKTVGFGIVYGMSPFGLARELSIEQAQAQEFIERYFARYPKVRRYLDRSLEEARARGYSLTLLGRRRNLPELSSRDGAVRQFAERMAVNTPIQGSAADLVKVAMVALDRELVTRGRAARIICQVHDELILELPEEERAETEAVVRETMERPVLAGRPVTLRVPLQVNLKLGRSWFECSH